MIVISDVFQIVFFLIVLVLMTPLLGAFMAKVFSGEKNLLSPILAGPERWIYKVCGVDASAPMDWKRYSLSLLVFNFFGFLAVFLLQLFQCQLPLNPLNLPNVSVDLAFNTAISFVTNTNWQSYAGETTLSYAVQMLGLTVQNFLSAATGIAVLIAVVRGLVNKASDRVGNFWVDLVRCTLYILLPLSVLLTVMLISEGVVQSLSGSAQVTTLEGAQQTIPLGPAASQIAIKQIGTNGGGFFNANGAHPFENPTPLTNFLECLAILLLPSALVFTFGKMVGSTRHGWILWGAMMFFLLIGLTISLIAEQQFNPVVQASASMEGKEVRIGVANSVLWSVVTTAASNGSVNAMHDSLSPLSGFVALLNIMLGEIIFGGVGAGMYGMFVFVILTVFIAGLMVGRTPEYLGKKIESFEVRMAALAVLAPGAVILVFSAVALLSGAGLSSLSNAGPHGLSQVLYAFSSAAGNNGSAFAGLNANTVFYNVALGLAMLIGRFGVILPVLAIAGSIAKKKITPPSVGTFRTDNLVFAALLIAIIIIVGALTFFPALSLGPIAEHLVMLRAQCF